MQERRDAVKSLFALGIGIGILSGLGGFFALFAALRLSRRVTETSNFGYLGLMLLGVLVSFLILFAGLILLVIFFRDILVPTAAAEVVVLLVCTIGYGIYKHFG